MEETKVKYQHWTKEEIALLANLMSKAFNAGKNQTEAAEFAATKLGRSKLACLGQYQAKMRGKSLSDFAYPGEEVEMPADLGSDTDIDKEPDYTKSFSFVDDLMNGMRGKPTIFEYEEVQEPIKITVHDGETTAEAEILIDKNDVVVAKVKGLIITIEL
jgi:hypothetical protein